MSVAAETLESRGHLPATASAGSLLRRADDLQTARGQYLVDAPGSLEVFEAQTRDLNQYIRDYNQAREKARALYPSHQQTLERISEHVEPDLRREMERVLTMSGASEFQMYPYAQALGPDVDTRHGRLVQDWAERGAHLGRNITELRRRITRLETEMIAQVASTTSICLQVSR